MESIGDALCRLCDSAEDEVLLVAPFIKREVVERVLNVIPDKIKCVQVVTRWRPEDVWAGVTDLDVYDCLVASRRGRLYVHPLLHAKYFRIDDKCIVGSANLTASGLGWITPPNLELSIETTTAQFQIESFERQLMAEVVVADQQMRDEIEAAVNALGEVGYRIPELFRGTGFSNPHYTLWLPLCSQPDKLYNIYANYETDRVLMNAVASGEKDLASLGIPKSLSKPNFETFVTAVLRQMPVIQHVGIKAAEDKLSDEKAARLLEKLVGALEYTAADHWEILKRWILYFFPGQYRLRPAGDVLTKGRVIQDR